MSIKTEFEEGIREGIRARAAALITDGTGLSHSRILSEVDRLRSTARMLRSIVDDVFKDNEN